MLKEDHALLLISLSCAVPLHMMEISGWTPEWRTAEATRCANEVAAHGDIMQFKATKKGDTAQAFNDLARGIAILAYQPGGVDFSGQHWCVDPHPESEHPTCRRSRVPS